MYMYYNNNGSYSFLPNINMNNNYLGSSSSMQALPTLTHHYYKQMQNELSKINPKTTNNSNNTLLHCYNNKMFSPQNTNQIHLPKLTLTHKHPFDINDIQHNNEYRNNVGIQTKAKRYKRVKKRLKFIRSLIHMITLYKMLTSFAKCSINIKSNKLLHFQTAKDNLIHLRNFILPCLGNIEQFCKEFFYKEIIYNTYDSKIQRTSVFIVKSFIHQFFSDLSANFAKVDDIPRNIKEIFTSYISEDAVMPYNFLTSFEFNRLEFSYMLGLRNMNREKQAMMVCMLLLYRVIIADIFDKYYMYFPEVNIVKVEEEAFNKNSDSEDMKVNGSEEVVYGNKVINDNEFKRYNDNGYNEGRYGDISERKRRFDEEWEMDRGRERNRDRGRERDKVKKYKRERVRKKRNESYTSEEENEEEDDDNYDYESEYQDSNGRSWSDSESESDKRRRRRKKHNSKDKKKKHKHKKHKDDSYSDEEEDENEEDKSESDSYENNKKHKKHKKPIPNKDTKFTISNNRRIVMTRIHHDDTKDYQTNKYSFNENNSENSEANSSQLSISESHSFHNKKNKKHNKRNESSFSQNKHKFKSNTQIPSTKPKTKMKRKPPPPPPKPNKTKEHKSSHSKPKVTKLLPTSKQKPKPTRSKSTIDYSSNKYYTNPLSIKNSNTIQHPSTLLHQSLTKDHYNRLHKNLQAKIDKETSIENNLINESRRKAFVFGNEQRIKSARERLENIMSKNFRFIINVLHYILKTAIEDNIPIYREEFKEKHCFKVLVYRNENEGYKGNDNIEFLEGIVQNEENTNEFIKNNSRWLKMYVFNAFHFCIDFAKKVMSSN